jgi:hypothetical protein
MNVFRPGFKRFLLVVVLLAGFGVLWAHGAPSTSTSTYQVSGDRGSFSASVSYTYEKAAYGIVIKEYPVEKLDGVRSTSNNAKLQPHFAFSLEVVDWTGKEYPAAFNTPLTVTLSYPKGTKFFILTRDKSRAVFLQDLKGNPSLLPDSTIRVSALDETTAVIQVSKWFPGDPCCGG